MSRLNTPSPLAAAAAAGGEGGARNAGPRPGDIKSGDWLSRAVSESIRANRGSPARRGAPYADGGATRTVPVSTAAPFRSWTTSGSESKCSRVWMDSDEEPDVRLRRSSAAAGARDRSFQRGARTAGRWQTAVLRTRAGGGRRVQDGIAVGVRALDARR
jgi:hypothetical protein